MTDQELSYAAAWEILRKDELKAQNKKEAGGPGRPNKVQYLILKELDREMTRGDVQTRLLVKHQVKTDNDTLSAHLSMLAKLGKIERVDSRMGMAIWGPRA